MRLWGRSPSETSLPRPPADLDGHRMASGGHRRALTRRRGRRRACRPYSGANSSSRPHRRERARPGQVRPGQLASRAAVAAAHRSCPAPGGSQAPLTMSARRARKGLANDLDEAQARRLLDRLVPETPGFLTSARPDAACCLPACPAATWSPCGTASTSRAARPPWPRISAPPSSRSTAGMTRCCRNPPLWLPSSTRPQRRAG